MTCNETQGQTMIWFVPQTNPFILYLIPTFLVNIFSFDKKLSLSEVNAEFYRNKRHKRAEFVWEQWWPLFQRDAKMGFICELRLNVEIGVKPPISETNDFFSKSFSKCFEAFLEIKYALLLILFDEMMTAFTHIFNGVHTSTNPLLSFCRNCTLSRTGIHCLSLTAESPLISSSLAFYAFYRSLVDCN